MKNLKSISLALVVVMVLSMILSSGMMTKVNAAETKGSIEVTGKGSVKVKADAVRVTLGVKTEGKTAQAAQQENAKQMDAVLKAIKKVKGVNDKDIETRSYSIYPRYQYVEKAGKSEIYGYEVNNSIVVDLKDITIIGDVLDTAVKSGVNVSNNLEFYVQNQEQFYYEALASAAKQAEKKAKTLSEALSITIGKPVSVVEQGTYQAPVFFRDNMAMEAKTMAAPSYDYIQEKELEITAEVRVTY